MNDLLKKLPVGIQDYYIRNNNSSLIIRTELIPNTSTACYHVYLQDNIFHVWNIEIGNFCGPFQFWALTVKEKIVI